MIANANMFERFAILDAGVATIFDIATGELQSVLQNCNSFQLTTKTTSKDVKERGETSLSFSSPMEGTLKFNTETTSFQQLSLALGSAGLVCNTSSELYQKTQDFTVANTSSIVFNLSAEAKDAKNVFVYLTTRDGELAKKLVFTLDATKKVVTVTADASIAEGDNIKIIYNTLMPAGKLYSFRVPSKGQNYTKRIVIDVLGTNRNDQSPMLMQFDVHKCVVNNGVDITMDAENPSKFSIEMKVLSDPTRKYDADTNGFFDVLMPVEDTTSVTPVSNLTANSTVAGKADLTFSGIDTSATGIAILYKKSTDSTYSTVATTGTTGVYTASTLNASATSAQVQGLTSASSYNIKLSYTVSGTTYESNVATVTIP